MNLLAIVDQDVVHDDINIGSDASITITSFGGLSICINDQCAGVQAWKSPKVYQLLLVIVALGGRNVSVVSICDLLWPDNDGDKAMQNFEFMLRRLRQVLKSKFGGLLRGRQSVMMHHGKVSLNADVFSLDSWRWEALSSQARRLRIKEQWESAFELEQLAMRLLSGPFLQGDHDKILMQRDVWHTRTCNWIHDTVGNWLQDVEISHGQVMDLLDRGLLIDPCSEKLCMQRMNILLDNGYKVDAMRVYKNWVTLVKSTLGMSPFTQEFQPPAN